MPKYLPKAERLRARNLIKVVLKHNGNQSEAAKELGVTRQAVSSRLRRVVAKKSFAEMMDRQGLTDKYLRTKLKEGLEATRPISCNVYVKDQTTGKEIGEMLDAGEATKDFVDIEDFPTRHKYLATALELKGHIKKESGGNSVSVVNINYGYRQPRDSAVR